jgi:protein tyrosine phosphatase (PTP) superfamily phosphohydrolase (DUF442 family)
MTGFLHRVLTERSSSAHLLSESRIQMFSTPRFALIALFLLVANARGADDSKVKKMEVPAIENFFSVTDSLYSGGGPETDEAFETLSKLGIKTIITVDGAKPKVELARKYGMRYIHLPHGYDGIPNETAVKLVKAAKTAEGPIFVHCHHGKHRGPAAVGVICQGVANWSAKSAESWMKKAGTAPDYDGLYKSVTEFRPPSAAELEKAPSNFPETAEVSAMVDTMVEIENRWDGLKKLTAKLEDRTKTASEAVLLWEQFREAQRLPESAQLGEAFQADMAKSEQSALRLREILSAHAKSGGATPPNLREALDEVARSCKHCHEAHRNAIAANRPRK